MRRRRPSARLAPPPPVPPVERHNTRWFNQQLEEIGALSPPYPWQEDEEEELIESEDELPAEEDKEACG